MCNNNDCLVYLALLIDSALLVFCLWSLRRQMQRFKSKK